MLVTKYAGFCFSDWSFCVAMYFIARRAGSLPSITVVRHRILSTCSDVCSGDQPGIFSAERGQDWGGKKTVKPREHAVFVLDSLIVSIPGNFCNIHNNVAVQQDVLAATAVTHLWRTRST